MRREYRYLEPQLEELCQEYVLAQAWKKTASYIRYHNWYSDTLELDITTVNLPRFLAELAELLKTPEQWQNDPLRLVPAPKSQRWHIDTVSGGRWVPVKSGKDAVKLRPLAHVSLMDQVAATAIMLCIADRVETIQGDPRSDIKDFAVRERVISYGNRLFCDFDDGRLRHRWGSGKLYRAYFQDYQQFLDRPEVVAANAAETVSDGARVAIVFSDLRQFYDRVRPNFLYSKIEALRKPEDDPRFFDFAQKLFSWTWHPNDRREVVGYASAAGLKDFSKVALPQGLVSAGFFANVALLDFDISLLGSIKKRSGRESVSLMSVDMSTIFALC